jgi:hypothetical protein
MLQFAQKRYSKLLSDQNYEMIIENMFDKYEHEGSLIYLHLDYFSENLNNFKDEQGERLHQNIKENGKEIPGKVECQRDNNRLLLLFARRRFRCNM